MTTLPADAVYLTPWVWRRLVGRRPGRSLRRPAALWAMQPVPGEEPIWFPFAHEDIVTEARRARQVFREAGVRRGDVVLSVCPEGPWVGNALPFLLTATDALVPDLPPLGAQVFPLSVLTVTFKADLTVFPFGQAPTVLIGAASDLRTVADSAYRAGAPRLRARLLLLLGPPTDAALLHDLAESIVPLAHLPGALAPFGGRPGRSGVCVPHDVVTAELIPDEEWGRAVQDPAYNPRAVPAAAALGESGELVVSYANHALPVVRFRTHERVRVVAAEAHGVEIERLPTV